MKIVDLDNLYGEINNLQGELRNLDNNIYENMERMVNFIKKTRGKVS